MIRSFKDRETRRFFEGRRVAVLQGFADQAVRRLILLNSAETLGDLAALPSNRLEALRGDRAGQSGSTAFGSTRNGASAFAGRMTDRKMRRSWIITEGM